MDENFPEFIDQPIDGTLDLHTFSPNEVKTLIPDYIEACLEKEITELRIIHGKGSGTLRALVHSILEKHPKVSSYWQEEGSGGSWGATIVDLRKD
ncbi:MAG: DNA mismatch repair protein MutS [candidate division Zixibacteria bacterium RBG_16_50_21]|nr:MAG: DNA mismatch repair protein MutS [candidate division Zixibacteria bacterium RBG_16_50_21]